MPSPPLNINHLKPQKSYNPLPNIKELATKYFSEQNDSYAPSAVAGLTPYNANIKYFFLMSLKQLAIQSKRSGKMTVINTNMAALKARLYGVNALGSQEVAMQRLSSGARINSSSDDAAGIAVAMKLNAQLQGQKAAIKTAADAVALLKTQEAGVKQFINIVHRIKELAIQMANGSYTDADRAHAQLEVDQLTDQFAMAASGTLFNSKEILNGTTATTYTIQAGANASDSFTINVIQGATIAGMLPSVSNVTNQANATLTADTAPSILQTMMEYIATIGASVNRLTSTIDNLSNASNNTEKALGRISDADFATESAKLTKEQLLVKISNQMIATANQRQNTLVQLLE